MRTDAYYWKCDNPLPVEEKLKYNDKYRLADITPLVRRAAEHHFRETPQAILSTGSAGNHYAYEVRFADRTLFFRADDGKTDDDYMLAEECAMRLARAQGVPAPRVHVTDVSLSLVPVRYQFIEWLADPPLRRYDQQGALDRAAVGRQLGRHTARLHRIRLAGFGFLNTEALQRGGEPAGLDASNRAYFQKKLPDHLRFLRDAQFLPPQVLDEIERLLARHDRLLDLPRGSLLHKDLAFWNVLGSHDRITAIIDWDDAVIGDPVDDIAIVKCFYGPDVIGPFLEGYRETAPLPDDFEARLSLYLLRNMLWKAVIRIFMRYFDMTGDFFILGPENRTSLRQFTLDRIMEGLAGLRRA